MSDLKAQEFYQLYRKKTIEAGYSPIGKQRFTGIIKTLSLIPETLDYIQDKANGVNADKKNFNLPEGWYLKELLIAYNKYMLEQIGAEQTILNESMVDGFLGKL